MEKLLLVWLDTHCESDSYEPGRFWVKSQFRDKSLIREKLLLDWLDTHCESELFQQEGLVLKVTGRPATELNRFDDAFER